MTNLIKHLVTALSGIRLIPLIALMLLCPNRDALFADMDHLARLWNWQLGGARRAPQAQHLAGRIIQFVSFMTWIREFRNVFYFRTGKAGLLLSILCRPLASLEIFSRIKIGPGLFINCRIYQQVTIGNVDAAEGGRPVIGDNVTVYAGAKIVGRVKIGDNVTIAANSLVIKDVAANTTVMGVPAITVWKK